MVFVLGKRTQQILLMTGKQKLILSLAKNSGYSKRKKENNAKLNR